MKLLEKSLLLAFILTALISFTGFTAGCEDIPNHVLRLHVLANSDTTEDQNLKLKVRDRILAESAGILDEAKNKEDAQQIIKSKIPLLKKAAQDEVKKNGYNYPVNVEMANMYFTTRKYDEVTLPTGDYDALRVTIGKAEGHNWWCVVFPPMCLPAAEESKELSDVLNSNQLQIVKQTGDFEVKFKTVELYEELKSFINNR